MAKRDVLEQLVWDLESMQASLAAMETAAARRAESGRSFGAHPLEETGDVVDLVAQHRSTILDAALAVAGGSMYRSSDMNWIVRAAALSWLLELLGGSTGSTDRRAGKGLPIAASNEDDPGK